VTLEGALSRIKRDGDCWIWTGGKTGATGRRQAYGFVRVEGGRRIGAHRFVYERMVGPVAEGMDLDHLCRTPLCVNPEHLEPVTHQENVRRGLAIRTHCKYGHEMAGDNLYIHPDGERKCRQCMRDTARRFAERNPKYGRRYYERDNERRRARRAALKGDSRARKEQA
jgi:hypothetical protein